MGVDATAHPEPTSTGAGDAHSLAAALAPALVRECEGRLGTIEWFRSTWQRGGAATGFARWHTSAGADLDVLVKVPIGPTEHRWTTRLGTVSPADWDSEQARALPVPRVVAAGRMLGGHDLAWLVMERLDGQPLSGHWCASGLEDLLRAAGRLQAAATHCEPPRPDSTSTPPDWSALVARSREAARRSDVPDAQKWNEALKRVHRIVATLTARWDARAINTWCHGDLHPGNAMRRAGPAPNSCVLIDLALIRPGHWIEDAVYLERQFWTHPEQLFGVHPVSHLARLRREQGLSTDGDYGQLANVRRVLMAACVPALFPKEGSTRYVQAALDVLVRLLPQVGG